eukprot:PLAT4238.1.p1 GENE.PLAT4238.1~~PLAT4238.1.p1  ORF type:complete len:878 (-),score=478.71 PLAT4238.1:1249-3882(-)
MSESKVEVQSVAVVGAGVSGLTAAYLINRLPGYKVTLYEADKRAGGHADTMEVDGMPIDTGFLVYNEHTYPNLLGLFGELGVDTEPSDMSFSVSIDNGRNEWQSDTLASVFATRSNLFNPWFWSMLADLNRFNKAAHAFVADPDEHVTLGDWLDSHRLGKAFRRMYFVPMCASVWSASAEDVMLMPAASMLRFMKNHNMLQFIDRPQWRTVRGRSRRYVQAVLDSLPEEAVKLGCAVTSITRPESGGAIISDATGETVEYDHVILAVHTDIAAELLGDDASAEEAELLAAVPYSDNVTYVHTDTALMPKRRAAWAAWNYIEQSGPDGKTAPVTVTYWLNKLQNLPGRDIFVTLNPAVPPREGTILRTKWMAHPQFTLASYAAQRRLPAMQGQRCTWFAGAWTASGFHEDGCKSGVEAVKALTGCPPPWEERAVAPMKLRPFGLLELLKRALFALLRAPVERLLSKMTQGCIALALPDGTESLYGDTMSELRARVKVKSHAFFMRIALETDLGLAKSYIADEWECDDLVTFFTIMITNRDAVATDFKPSGMLTSWIGQGMNYLFYKLMLDNSLANSRRNISAHYDLSNQLFEHFLDREHMIYSSAIYDIDRLGDGRLHFKDSLESGITRKLDNLIAMAKIGPEDVVLDLGFGWGGFSIRAAEKTGCTVRGITLSKEQLVYAQAKVAAKGLEDKVTFELCDYREFARKNRGVFDKIVSIEMIEAVGHKYLGEFFQAAEMMLKPKGLLVMEAITTAEFRYDEYIKSTDLISVLVFPGSCCPSLHALLTAMKKNSKFVMTDMLEINRHYAKTLADWRVRFNSDLDAVRAMGFDDAFIRTWDYYLTYCEAGFETQNLGCVQLQFTRTNNEHLWDPYEPVVLS